MIISNSQVSTARTPANTGSLTGLKNSPDIASGLFF